MRRGRRRARRATWIAAAMALVGVALALLPRSADPQPSRVVDPIPSRSADPVPSPVAAPPPSRAAATSAASWRVAFREPERRLPRDRDETWAVALGDVDGDGDVDALLANRSTQNRLLLSDGAARFTDATDRLPPDRSFSADAALADFDGDGDLDAFLANFQEQNRLYDNDGSGRFRDVTERLPRDGALDQAVAVGDLDADGDLDLLLGTSLGQRDRLLDNVGGGSFELTDLRIPGFGTRTICVVLGDLDGDGYLDAFLGTQAGSPSLLYVNDGTGVLVDRSESLPRSLAGTQDVALGDVDGDGDLDVLLANGGPGPLEQLRNELYLNDGRARLADAPGSLPGDLDFSFHALLVDVDGDADLDVLVGGRGASRLYLGDGRGGFDAAPTPLPAGLGTVLALAAEDLDGDRAPDVLLGVDGPDALLRNDGTGAFRDETATPPMGERRTLVRAVVCADLDGDGRVDAYVANGEEKLCRGEADRLLLGDGHGRFRDVSERLPGHVDVSSSAALGDVDGDGDVDVLVGTAGVLGRGTPNRLLRNDGAARFADASELLPAGVDATWTVALIDLDRDGDLDAWIGNGSEFSGAARPDRLLLNDGHGRFADASERLPAEAMAATSAVACGDVDLDGDVDVLLVDRDGPERVLSNDGTARFHVAAGAWPEGAYLLGDRTNGALLVDVDGDGDLDAVLANGGADRPNRLFLGDGAGRFVDGSFLLPALPPDRLWTTSVAAADFDGDGRPDLVFGSAATPELEGGATVLRNHGDGNFLDGEAGLVAGDGDVTALATADLDGDGTADLVLGHWQQPLRVHLTRPGAR